jgi:hypothetical protein
MKAAILNKISQELSNDINTESKVLYLLAEIRKYIDGCSQKEKNKYPNLYFYCNWVLHIELSHSPAIKILNRFKSIFENINDLKKMSKIFIKQERNFYLFIDLKKELRNFIEANGLSTKLLENTNKWSRFKKLLVKILMEAPLVNEAGRVNRFSYEKGDDEQIRFRVKIRKLGSFKVTLKEK